MEHAVIVSDTTGVISQWNKGAEALFGYRADEAAGQSLDLVVPERQAIRERQQGELGEVSRARKFYAAKPKETAAIIARSVRWTHPRNVRRTIVKQWNEDGSMGRKRRDESYGLRAGWRKRWSRPSAAMDVEPLLGLDEALAALGRCPHHPRGLVRREAATVPVESIVGTLARGEDFDRLFRPLNPSLRNRRERLARAGAAGLSPVSLVRVGELYFVEDGHHRISLARARDQLAVDALVRSVCTVAFACACLTQNDLQVKAAKRRFLECVPLPDPDLRDVWLDDPAGYEVLVAAARRWSAQHSDTAVAEDEGDLEPAVAAAWWRRHVVPLAHRAGCDGAGSIAAAYLCIHEPPLQ